jgi:hypothetical protein
MTATGLVIASLDGPPDAEWRQHLAPVVPDDALRSKRLGNLARARQVIVASDDGSPVGVVFVRTIAGIPNVTWLVAERARRRGLAVAMLARLQQDWRWLTAVCRTDASRAVARRAGFITVGPLAVWRRGAR